MKLFKSYSRPTVSDVTLECDSGYLLVDSGKPALAISPIEAEVDPFTEDPMSSHDFGEISFL